MKGTLHPSDLLVHGGRTYHLRLSAGELSPDILIVGDPGRAAAIAHEFFETIEAESSHRGLRTITGIVRCTNQRVTVTTSGMGTPSLEIVLNELVALNEINLENGERKTPFEPLTIIRVGTSGALQPETELGTAIITEYAVGLDNTGLFYDLAAPDGECLKLEEQVEQILREAARSSARFSGRIHPYAARANSGLVEALTAAARDRGVRFQTGITLSNAGFFAPQGRDVSRAALTLQGLAERLEKTAFAGMKFMNMEMEASFLLHFMNGIGCRAAAICTAVANRYHRSAKLDYEKSIHDATQIALDALREAASRS